MDFISKTINLKRVVVTGLGLISPIGKTVDESWKGVMNGKNGVSYFK